MNMVLYSEMLNQKYKCAFLIFSIYRKPTNGENYLHYFSYSASQVKVGLAQSLFLRAYRICDKGFL